MDKIILTEENFKLLEELDLSEMGSRLVLKKYQNIVETSDIDLLLIIINEYISTIGMDENQDNCTEYGRELYGLYDEIYNS